MSASKIHPNVWQGVERSGGFIAKNKQPKSASSPHHKGRVYLAGVGWYWVSVWWKTEGEIGRVSMQEMTDAQAAQYCAPKPEPGYKPRSNGMQTSHQKHHDPGTDDIPF